MSEEIVKPKPYTPEWENYVLSLFQESELIDGKPRMAGLLRVSQLLLGPIVEESTNVLLLGGGIQIVYSATFNQNFGLTSDSYRSFNVVRVGTADCTQENGGKFSKYASAMAESRARARCYRFALGLSTIAADEVDTILEKEGEIVANDAQLKLIARKAKILNYDVDNYVKKTYNKEVEKLSQNEATLVLKFLNKGAVNG